MSRASTSALNESQQLAGLAAFLAGIGSLGWPVLVSTTVMLAVVAAALRAARWSRDRAEGTSLNGRLPGTLAAFAIVGLGWAGFLSLPAPFLALRPLVLGTSALLLWWFGRCPTPGPGSGT